MIELAQTTGGDASDPRHTAALIDRVQLLRLVLPGLATDVAIARREAARLRCENAKLNARVRELEAQSAASAQELPPVAIGSGAAS
jgi:hypothetical protein